MHGTDKLNAVRGALGLSRVLWTVQHSDREGLKVGELLDSFTALAGRVGGTERPA